MRKLAAFILILVLAGAVGIWVIGRANDNAKLTDPAALTQGVSTVDSLNPFKSNSISPEDQKLNEEQVIKDFKSDISNRFKAWKGADINEFRRIYSLGFAGNLLEDKVKEAEPFVLEGEGADINNINYKNTKVVQVEAGKAIVESEYDYSGYAYNLATGQRGDAFSPVDVKCRYTLDLINNKWYITSEQSLQ